MKKYKLVVAGGTFDNLHKGHELFLDFLLSLSDKVLLGITSDQFVKNKLPTPLQSFAVRRQSVLDYLHSHNAEERIDIVAIDSIYPPLSWQEMPVEAIIATDDTKKGALLINEKRKEDGLAPLAIEVMPLENAEDGIPISSTRIRNGEIAKDGKVFLSTDSLEKSYRLPEQLRSILKKPFGTLIVDNDFDYSRLPMERVITVGDIATKTFLDRNLIPRIAIVDFVVERKQAFSTHMELGFPGDEIILQAENPAGQITQSLLKAIVTAFSYPSSKHIVITVKGEEDLGVTPCILKAPLHSHIFYGQPGEGIVKIDVTTELKETIHEFFGKLNS